jgi:SAM-dependent methyltransferase
MTDTVPRTFDNTTPHSARVWNYWLDGKDNFGVDRQFGDQYVEIYPGIVDLARASRAFLARAVGFLAAEAGIRQFLDVGVGLPAADNTHEIAQRVAPACRIAYVDNDPMVLIHARALLTGTPEGATAYIDADVHHPGKILAEAAETLDFTRPVALLLVGIMGHVADTEEAYTIVKQLVDSLPPGSYLVLSDRTVSDTDVRLLDEGPAGTGHHNRSPDEIARFFDGLHVVEPGVVSAPFWRPDVGATPSVLDVHCGVGRNTDSFGEP